jgi:hypothetical protein
MLMTRDPRRGGGVLRPLAKASLAHSVALHFMHYNFCRVHQTLRVTPAMEAKQTDHVWEIEELVELLPR